MAIRAVVCLIIAAAVLAGDWSKLGKASGKARAVYAVIVLYALYSSAGYVSGHPLPNVNNLLTAWLQKPATAIDDTLKARRPEDIAAHGSGALHSKSQESDRPAWERMYDKAQPERGGAK